MDYSRIDVIDLPGYGDVWQGGTVDKAIDELPDPILIICMDKGESNEKWINHDPVQAVVAIWIHDKPKGVLRDDVLIGLVHAGAAWLASGGNLYIHCKLGISRSSYYDVALHMYVLDIPYVKALAAIKKDRPIAEPNPWFAQQLTRLEPQLMKSGKETS